MISLTFIKFYYPIMLETVLVTVNSDYNLAYYQTVLALECMIYCKICFICEFWIYENMHSRTEFREIIQVFSELVLLGLVFKQ